MTEGKDQRQGLSTLPFCEEQWRKARAERPAHLPARPLQEVLADLDLHLEIQVGKLLSGDKKMLRKLYEEFRKGLEKAEKYHPPYAPPDDEHK